eukprot:TRINITY_DN2597_c0_g1_i1.p1 TRINITY_DN2597_c0_g1~~TRINITY_DN2597_c0_g1_i1.p1  ORF type:complete len:441 (+),score=148.03 TRINITY_DN2597_c0_g1_i1:65-1387(+)
MCIRDRSTWGERKQINKKKSRREAGQQQQQMTLIHTNTVQLAYLSIVAIHVLAYLIEVPVFIQLFVNAMACIYIGSYRAIHLSSPEKLKEEGIQSIETMSTKDAYMFPVYGSCVLLSIYFVFKFIDKSLLGYVFTAYFTFLGVLCVMQIFETHLETFMPKQKKQILINREFTIDLKIYKNEIKFELSTLRLVCFFLALIPTVLYLIFKNWVTNNIFGVCFSIVGIESLVLPNFKVGFILLWGLFFYDIFWVYGTDVMLTVAKSVDAPIKLIFPVNLAVDPPKFSMLGLGDIVIPGIFVALCLKYDFDKLLASKKSVKEFAPEYFRWCLCGYAVGILATFQVMVIFNHAQPALLYLVPGVCLSILLLAFIRNEIKTLFKYEESDVRKHLQEIKEKQITTHKKPAVRRKPLVRRAQSSSHFKAAEEQLGSIPASKVPFNCFL